MDSIRRDGSAALEPGLARGLTAAFHRIDPVPPEAQGKGSASERPRALA